MDPREIEKIIQAGMTCTAVQVQGDGRHFEAVVVSEAFEGQPMLKRHRLVHETLGDRFDTDALHALSIKAYTPAQWERLGG